MNGKKKQKIETVDVLAWAFAMLVIIAVAIPFYILMQNLHLMDNIWAIILPWAIPAFNLFLMKNYFENVPNEIYEAAVVDGASEYRILAKIYVPLGLPIFATIGLFVATSSWNDYMVPLM